MRFLLFTAIALIYQSSIANDLVAEINSEKFSPTLFNYSWDITENELVDKGFICSTFVNKDKLTRQRSCRNKNYRMELDSHVKKFDSELAFIFGDDGSDCEGEIAIMTYTEDFSKSLIATKLADARYMALRKALGRKFNRYTSVANDITSDTGIPRNGYKLGEKVAALLIKISENYVKIHISYNSQCFSKILLNKKFEKERSIDSQL